MNAWVHTDTKPQISSTRSRVLGWRIHGSVEDTKLSTNKQHTLSQRQNQDQHANGKEGNFNSRQVIHQYNNTPLQWVTLHKTPCQHENCGVHGGSDWYVELTQPPEQPLYTQCV
jgi:hypothetical protein